MRLLICSYLGITKLLKFCPQGLAQFEETYDSDVNGWFSLQTAAQMAEHRCHREWTRRDVYKSQYLTDNRATTIPYFSLL